MSRPPGYVSGALRIGCITAISVRAGTRGRPALPGEVTERNLYATVQRQPVRAFAAGPGRDWLPFTDTNVIFAGWPGGPHPGRAGQARRPADPAGSLARTAGPGHRGGCREHGHAGQGRQVTGVRGRAAGIASPRSAHPREAANLRSVGPGSPGRGEPEGTETRRQRGQQGPGRPPPTPEHL